MKKIVILTVLALFAAAPAFAGIQALATGAVTAQEGSSIYGGVDAADALATTHVLIGKMSKGVKFTSGYTSIAYAIATKHTSGSKEYGTSYDSTAIKFRDVGLAGLAAVSGTTEAAFGTGWTTM